MDWKSKAEIPDGEILYRYAYPKAFPEGQEEIPLHIFADENLSCDWEKYQKHPNKSRHINEGKTFIIEIEVCDEIRNPRNPKRIGEIVDSWKQNIIHDPDQQNNNYSHSLISGKKKGAVQKAIQRASKVYMQV